MWLQICRKYFFSKLKLLSVQLVNVSSGFAAPDTCTFFYYYPQMKNRKSLKTFRNTFRNTFLSYIIIWWIQLGAKFHNSVDWIWSTGRQLMITALHFKVAATQALLFIGTIAGAARQMKGIFNIIFNVSTAKWHWFEVVFHFVEMTIFKMKYSGGFFVRYSDECVKRGVLCCLDQPLVRWT